MNSYYGFMLNNNNKKMLSKVSYWLYLLYPSPSIYVACGTMTISTLLFLLSVSILVPFNTRCSIVTFYDRHHQRSLERGG